MKLSEVVVSSSKVSSSSSQRSRAHGKLRSPNTLVRTGEVSVHTKSFSAFQKGEAQGTGSAAGQQSAPTMEPQTFLADGLNCGVPAKLRFRQSTHEISRLTLPPRGRANSGWSPSFVLLAAYRTTPSWSAHWRRALPPPMTGDTRVAPTANCALWNTGNPLATTSIYLSSMLPCGRKFRSATRTWTERDPPSCLSVVPSLHVPRGRLVTSVATQNTNRRQAHWRSCTSRILRNRTERGLTNPLGRTRRHQRFLVDHPALRLTRSVPRVFEQVIHLFRAFCEPT